LSKSACGRAAGDCFQKGTDIDLLLHGYWGVNTNEFTDGRIKGELTRAGMNDTTKSN
jgi:hypothetical protein